MKESRQGVDSRLVLRLNMADEDTLRSQNCVPSNITFANGVASFNGTSSYIQVGSKPLKVTYSVRIKGVITSFADYNMLIDFRSDPILNTVGYIRSNITTGLIYYPGPVDGKYLNGSIATNFTLNTPFDLVVSGIPSIVSISSRIGRDLPNSSFSLNGSIDLLEIYQGTLTAQEVSNLYNNKAYKPFLPHGAISGGSTANLILDVNALKGTIRNTLAGGVLNGVTVPQLVNTNVVPIRDGNVWAMRFNKDLSTKLDCGSYHSLTGDISVSLWIKPSSYGSSDLGGVISNGKLKIITRGVGNNSLYFYSDGITAITSTLRSFILGKWYHYSAIRKSDGKTTTYINGVQTGASDQAGNTPIAGNDNLIIGSQASSTIFMDGNIASIRIYQGILSQSEISQLYTSEKSKYNL